MNTWSYTSFVRRYYNCILEDFPCSPLELYIPWVSNFLDHYYNYYIQLLKTIKMWYVYWIEHLTKVDPSRMDSLSDLQANHMHMYLARLFAW